VLVAVLSFTSWGGLGSPQFVGLANWKTLVHDPVMLKSLWLSLLLTALGLVVQTPISILIGVWAAGHRWRRWSVRCSGWSGSPGVVVRDEAQSAR
jgi:xylobiose transport system permease protein